MYLCQVKGQSVVLVIYVESEIFMYLCQVKVQSALLLISVEDWQRLNMNTPNNEYSLMSSRLNQPINGLICHVFIKNKLNENKCKQMLNIHMFENIKLDYYNNCKLTLLPTIYII